MTWTTNGEKFDVDESSNDELDAGRVIEMKMKEHFQPKLET